MLLLIKSQFSVLEMNSNGNTCLPVLHKPAFYFMGALPVFLCPFFPAAAVRLLPTVQIWVISPDGWALNSCTHVFWGRGGELTYADKYVQVVICNGEVHSPTYMQKGTMQYMVLIYGTLMFLMS